MDRLEKAEQLHTLATVVEMVAQALSHRPGYSDIEQAATPILEAVKEELSGG